MPLETALAVMSTLCVPAILFLIGHFFFGGFDAGA
jgi:hypothetical protein